MTQNNDEEDVNGSAATPPPEGQDAAPAAPPPGGTTAAAAGDAGAAELWPELTPREREVLELHLNGLGPEAIARALFISVNTVNRHLQHIRDRLGAHSQTALILEALRRGWRPSNQPGGVGRPRALLTASRGGAPGAGKHSEKSHEHVIPGRAAVWYSIGGRPAGVGANSGAIGRPIATGAFRAT